MLHEIQAAITNGLPYLAMMQALAVPDICGALMASDGRATRSAYLAWYGEYMWGNFILLSPEQCYSLRCGFVHQSRSDLAGGHFKRIAFHCHFWGAMDSMPMVDMGDTLYISVEQFCAHLNNAAHRWFATVAFDPTVLENAQSLLKPKRSLNAMMGSFVLS
ncbi:hypothetical protein [Sphingomonas limnosediminicola]|uniref:hypothetical protein n=1 Tax=Sphingomonas limnosediminicola TaxID=940133 RepID=UPI0031DCA6FD